MTDKSRPWYATTCSFLIAIIAWTLAILLCCSGPFLFQRYDVWKHQRAWEQHHIDDYRLIITSQGGGGISGIPGQDAEGELIVCNGQIEQIDRGRMIVPCEDVLDRSECRQNPIEALFQEARSSNPLFNDINYDKNYHYPRSIIGHSMIEGGGVVVRDFQPITCD